MGSVYVGVQRGAAGFERRVAIKRTHGHLLEDPDTRDMILREARNASAVRHPNVVSINDVEEIDGELLLVMDFIEGASLSQLLATGKQIPIGIALSIVLDACAGLSAIHTARDKYGSLLGLIHRDVSPQNILVGLDGTACIADFGIAKSTSDPTRTAKGVRRGKFGYMAPEYVLAGMASTSSDLFALGVVLWEALAGRRLFKGETDDDSIRLMVAAIAPGVREYNPQVSPALEAVVMKALAGTPEARFDSLTDFGKQLEIAAQGLVATRSDVSEWVASSNVVKSSVSPTAHVPTVAESDAELHSRPFEPQLSIRTREEASDDDDNDEETPSDEDEAAQSMDGPPIPFNAQSPRLHRVFRLDEVSETRAVSTSTPDALEAHASTPIEEAAATALSAKRSYLLFFVAVGLLLMLVALTTAVAYAGLIDTPAATSR